MDHHQCASVQISIRQRLSTLLKSKKYQHMAIYLVAQDHYNRNIRLQRKQCQTLSYSISESGRVAQLSKMTTSEGI